MIVGKTYDQARRIAEELLRGGRVYYVSAGDGGRMKKLVGEVLNDIGADQSLMGNLEVTS